MTDPQNLIMASGGTGFYAMLLVISGTAALCSGLILLLKPLFVRYALARPSSRGLHNVPTPQGGGLAVILATITVCLCLAEYYPLASDTRSLLIWLLLSVAGLAALGAADDIWPLPVFPRLLGQVVLIALPFVTMPEEWRLFHNIVPFWLERGLLVLGMVWFVNLTNFMDGMDWMSVAQIIPLCASLSIIACFGFLPPPGGMLALSLLGAMLGFAPFNRPVAGLFLGDVGSLPIGLVTGFCLMLLALKGEWAAAFLLPLYYLTDSSVTLMHRLVRGAKVWEPHREHFYQRAALNGWSSLQVTGCVFVQNLFLAAMALASIWLNDAITSVGLLGAGMILVALFLCLLIKK